MKTIEICGTTVEVADNAKLNNYQYRQSIENPFTDASRLPDVTGLDNELYCSRNKTDDIIKYRVTNDVASFIVIPNDDGQFKNDILYDIKIYISKKKLKPAIQFSAIMCNRSGSLSQVFNNTKYDSNYDWPLIELENDEAPSFLFSSNLFYKFNLKSYIIIKQGNNMIRKQRKETILTFSDIVKSFNAKVKLFGTITEYMSKLPMLDKTICKTYNMDDPAKDLVVKCTYRIPFKMVESQFMDWGKVLRVIPVIPAAITKDSKCELTVKFDIDKNGKLCFKIDALRYKVWWNTRNGKDWIRPAECGVVNETSVKDIIETALKDNSRRKVSAKRITDDFEWFSEAVEACLKAMSSDQLRDAYQARNILTIGRAIASLK